MIFKELILNNFRQYKGENKFEFPYSDKPITLLIARNGVGKTTFLQAFRFCFYGENQNALKLPKSEELLNNSLRDELHNLGEAELSVQVKFEHDGKDYLAHRSVKFKKINKTMTRITKNSDDDFVLLEDTGSEGMKEVEDGLKRLKEMMPVGLVNLYMFDGERVEIAISSPEFQKGFKESIVGLLGLNKLEQAIEFLGEKTRKSSLIGKVNLQIKPSTESEQEVKNKEKEANLEIQNLSKDIEDAKRRIGKFNVSITEQKEVQKSIDEIKDLIHTRDIFQGKVEAKEKEIELVVKKANDLASQLLLKVEIAKTYDKYQAFINSEEEQPDIFENLYESVVQDILKKRVCICGRPVHEGSHEAENLKQLSVLPYDNAQYLGALKSLFATLDDMPQQKNKLKNYSAKKTQLKEELEKLNKSFEKANAAVIEKEKSRGENKQTNIDKMIGYRKSAQIEIEQKNEKIEIDNRILSGISHEIAKINVNTAHNRKVNSAVLMLEQLQYNLVQEFENKKEIARVSIELNMNKVLAEVMNDEYTVELNDQYSLKVWKSLNNGYMEEETELLSTGQNVMMNLSFLRALLMTVEEHAEFDEVNKSGVIMDAALSNLDETHIKEISRKVLNTFNQLIFLSFKKQLRNELISGIKNKIGKVYELSKDKNGNIITKVLNVDNIEEYVNEGKTIS